MPEPIQYDILLNVQTALRAISTAGGYHHDVASGAVSIDAADGLELLMATLIHDPFFVVEFSSTSQPDYFPAEQMREFLPIMISAAANAEQITKESKAKTYAHLCSDIEKALVVDHTRGALATDTRIGPKQWFFGGGNSTRVLATVDVVVRVYREYGKPDG